jgi:hypothetical protein
MPPTLCCIRRVRTFKGCAKKRNSQSPPNEKERRERECQKSGRIEFSVRKNVGAAMVGGTYLGR